MSPVASNLNRVTGTGVTQCSIPMLGVYWPASAGAVAEAWEISSTGAVTTAPLSSPTMPFTPTGNTSHGESSSEPGEIVAGRTLCFRGSTGWNLLMLSDDGLTAYIWDVKTGSVVTATPTGVSASYDRVLLFRTPTGAALVYAQDSLKQVWLVQLSSSGIISSATYIADARFDEFYVQGGDPFGVRLMLFDSDDGAGEGGFDIGTYLRVNFDGSTTLGFAGEIATAGGRFNSGQNRKFVVCATTGIGIENEGVSAYTTWLDGRGQAHRFIPPQGDTANASVTSVQLFSFADATFAITETAQHISGGKDGIGIFRYETDPLPGLTRRFSFYPASGSTSGLKNEPGLNIANRTSDSARPHQCHLADLTPTFTY